MLTVPAWEEALPLFQLDPQQQHHHLTCLFREPPYSHPEDRDMPDLGIMLAQPRSEVAVAQRIEPTSSTVALHWPEAQAPLQTLTQLLSHSVQ
jgi:hypothetical protein